MRLGTIRTAGAREETCLISTRRGGQRNFPYIDEEKGTNSRNNLAGSQNRRINLQNFGGTSTKRRIRFTKTKGKIEGETERKL